MLVSTNIFLILSVNSATLMGYFKLIVKNGIFFSGLEKHVFPKCIIASPDICCADIKSIQQLKNMKKKLLKFKNNKKN